MTSSQSVENERKKKQSVTTYVTLKSCLFWTKNEILRTLIDSIVVKVIKANVYTNKNNVFKFIKKFRTLIYQPLSPPAERLFAYI